MEMVDGWLLRRLSYPHERRPPVPFRRRPSGHQILSGRSEEEKNVLFMLVILLRTVIVALEIDIERVMVIYDVLVDGRTAQACGTNHKTKWGSRLEAYQTLNY